MKVMKFGGSSVRDAERIRAACSIAGEQRAAGEVVVVCSAMKGVTDQLISAARAAEAADGTYDAEARDLERRHREAAGALLRPQALETFEATLGGMFDELSNVLRGVDLVRECSPRSMDLIMSFGERLNCSLISAYLRESGCESEYVDARQIIVTNGRHGSAEVDFAASNERIRAQLSGAPGLPIVTGFVASTPEGVTTTLGRNGSDYTASILGAALDAEVVEIWTDVDGVLSADPRYVPNAFVIGELSFEEAMEMSFFGAEVIHPYTMIPVVERNIPIRIKNTMNPAAPGTIIAKNVRRHTHPITGVASIEHVSLVNVEGGGLLGSPGVASRVFRTLGEADVNIVMISQASSEHSICLVCRDSEAPRAAAALKRELARELNARTIHQIEMIGDLEIIAIIGENMRGTPGISGRLFSSLGEESINVLAIAQGSSERNISLVIRRKDRERALRAIHRAFLE